MSTGDGAPEEPLWSPSRERVARARLTAFARLARERGGPDDERYASLHAWSVAHPERFWPLVWEFCGVVADARPGAPPWDDVLVGGGRMAPPDAALGPRWFPGARLNFAENLLRFRDARPALVCWNEEGRQRALSYEELHAEVSRVALALREAGVGAGDRVAGFMPNIAETVIAMLATASLGAVWSSCSPDFGAQGVLDRFGQIAPKVLFAADGYRYAGKAVDCLERLAEIVRRIPAIERVVVVPYLNPGWRVAGGGGGCR